MVERLGESVEFGDCTICLSVSRGMAKGKSGSIRSNLCRFVADFRLFFYWSCELLEISSASSWLCECVSELRERERGGEMSAESFIFCHPWSWTEPSVLKNARLYWTRGDGRLPCSVFHIRRSHTYEPFVWPACSPTCPMLWLFSKSRFFFFFKLCVLVTANSEANSRRIAMVENAFGSGVVRSCSISLFPLQRVSLNKGNSPKLSFAIVVWWRWRRSCIMRGGDTPSFGSCCRFAPLTRDFWWKTMERDGLDGAVLQAFEDRLTGRLLAIEKSKKKIVERCDKSHVCTQQWQIRACASEFAVSTKKTAATCQLVAVILCRIDIVPAHRSGAAGCHTQKPSSVTWAPEVYVSEIKLGRKLQLALRQDLLLIFVSTYVSA